MTLPVYFPSLPGPAPHLTISTELGLGVAVSCLVVSLVMLGFGMRERSSWRRLRARLSEGTHVVEGPVVVAGKRLTDKLFEAMGGDLLVLGGAPLTLSLGEPGYVTGLLVGGEHDPGPEHRIASRPCVARLMPVDGRYEATPGAPVMWGSLRADLFAVLPAVVMTGVAAFAAGVPEGDLRDALCYVWICLAIAQAIGLVGWLGALWSRPKLASVTTSPRG